MALLAANRPPLQVPPPRSPPNPNPIPRPLIPPATHLLSSTGALKTTGAKRTGKQRYPSEKKKLERMSKIFVDDEIKTREEGFWRLSELKVHTLKDPGKDFVGVSLPLLQAIAKVIEFPVASMLPAEAFTVVRKSFDARKVLKDSNSLFI